MTPLLSDRADRLVRRIFVRPQPPPEQEPQTDPAKLLHTLRKRRADLDQPRRNI